MTGVFLMNEHEEHPLEPLFEGLKPYTIEGYGTCTPPSETKESE